MFTRQRPCKVAVFTIALLLSLSSAVIAQEKSKKKKTPLQGTPVLWKDPGDISARNLLLGAGGEEMKPDISEVTFLKDEVGGYSAGFRVRDAAGNIWVAKLGKEAQPETASSRFVWAVGYVSEIHYLFPCVHIKGAPDKNVERCEGKGFANVRFEARPKNFKRQGTIWNWAKNPFSGTKELRGLIVLMAFLNNWDLKDDNNKLIYVPGSDGGQGEIHYILSDLGATFGKTGGFMSRSRNDPEDYAKSRFIEGVEGGRVKFAYSGKNSALFKDITVEDARWVGNLLSRLSDEQITDAFRAGNFTQEEIQLLVPAVRARINQLVNLPG
ncbi:MAG TPA: hypothetical protein VJT09_15890 [Pyrinomonadaceae bacterium]|nr:hypothetical protein [Pyrinomonadaceae bacterium]